MGCGEAEVWVRDKVVPPPAHTHVQAAGSGARGGRLSPVPAYGSELDGKDVNTWEGSLALHPASTTLPATVPAGALMHRSGEARRAAQTSQTGPSTRTHAVHAHTGAVRRRQGRYQTQAPPKPAGLQCAPPRNYKAQARTRVCRHIWV
jgi:hypothetical protein